MTGDGNEAEVPPAPAPLHTERPQARRSAQVIRGIEIAAALAAIIGAAAAVWALAGSGSAPAVLRASISTPAIYMPRTEYTYFNSHPGQLAREEAHFRAHGVSSTEARKIMSKRGLTFEFTTEVEAPPGRQFRLQETLYRLPDEVSVSPLNGHFPATEFTVRAARYEETESGWIEYPPRAGDYFLEVALVDSQGHTIGRPARSRPFSVHVHAREQ